MRMATFNILHGRSIDDGKVDVDRLTGFARRLDADVLALQEVDCDQPRSAMADLTAVAAEAMGAVSHRFVAAVSGTPGASWMAATGHEQPGTASYGIALLSRFDTDLGPLTVANTHLSFVPGWNRVQLRRLTRDLRGFPGPRVLMGDLTMSPPTPQHWTRLRPLATALTFPIATPNRQLDHILTDDARLVADTCSAPTLSISDHRPLIIDVSRQ
jgi:endonuclease/exonuclease/phosphatase family metal-dependent hydrolase